MDYAPPMLPAGMYGHIPINTYPLNMRYPRHNNLILPPQPPRSALLDEFRANKVRKWELRVLCFVHSKSRSY